ncbi:MAG: AIR synthase [Firmicutes bacterium]|nr:AIR synthase [Bacillota bacterium]
MQVGKLPPAALQQLIFDQLGQRRSEIVLRGALGEDSAALDLGGDLCVIATDPITGAVKNAGWLAVHVSCNDIAANGADPVAVLLTILLPEGSSQQLVAEIMADAERAAAEIRVEIVGGHTELTAAVNQPVISAVAVGRVPAGQLATSNNIHPGDSLVVTKYVGLEGTAILAWDFPHLVEPVVGKQLLLEAQALAQQLSVVPEARIAAAYGVRAMHDATEGGVLGAAYELAKAAGLGFELVEQELPLHPATQMLAEHFRFDPLRLISSGTLLLATAEPAGLIARLQQAHIPAKVVGRFTAAGETLLLRDNGKVEPVEAPAGDELWRLQKELLA